MLDRLIALDGSSDLALAARVARARALKELDSLEDARADLEVVLERLPPQNLLHVQARQLLRELDQQEPLSGAPARARGARPRGP